MVNSYLKLALIGLLSCLVGLCFPLIFVLLDLNQLQAELDIENIKFVIDSQSIYFFSFLMFPVASTLLGLIFYKKHITQMELQKANESLIIEERKSIMNAKLAYIGELSAGIGHEINNPLMIIKGNIRLARKEFDGENQRISKYFDRIDKNFVRIEKILQGLKTIARFDDPADVIDLHSLIKDSVDFIEEVYKLERVNIIINLQATQYHIMGHFSHFSQIFLNLLSNAKDATIERGVEQGLIKVSTYNKNDYFVMTITDNGKGIAEENLKKIFNTFFTTKKIGKGTGIGLSVVHNFIHEMNGTIDVKSKVSEGTTFIIEFPTVKPKEVSEVTIDGQESTFAVEEDTKVSDEITNMKILIVDDEEQIRDLIKGYFSEHCLHIDEAVDGLDALEKAKNIGYDIVITDVKMPNLDGIELSYELLHSIKFKGKIIVISGGNIQELSIKVNEFFKQNNITLLKKPFEKKDIISIVEMDRK